MEKQATYGYLFILFSEISALIELKERIREIYQILDKKANLTDLPQFSKAIGNLYLFPNFYYRWHQDVYLKEWQWDHDSEIGITNPKNRY